MANHNITTACDLDARIKSKGARLETMRKVCQGYRGDLHRHLHRCFGIVFYSMVLRPHEADIIAINNAMVQGDIDGHTGGIYDCETRFGIYASYCDEYHRNVLHDDGLPILRREWHLKDPETPPTFPSRIEAPAECFTPVTR